MKRRNFIISLAVGSSAMALAERKRQKQIFLVIDDSGLALHETQQFLDIPVPMTIAVLPHLEDTKACCIAVGRDEQKEIILHQPMEAYDETKKTGPGAIMNTTPSAEVRKIIDSSLRSVRGAVGMNNHMGSRVTENPELVSEVLQFCKAHDLFFLDSKTAFNSQVPRIAEQMGMHVEQRHVFLDINHNRDFIRMVWGDAVSKAKENGYVIVIGHVWSKESAAAIRDSYEGLLNQGYTFHRLSELYE